MYFGTKVAAANIATTLQLQCIKAITSLVVDHAGEHAANGEKPIKTLIFFVYLHCFLCCKLQKQNNNEYVFCSNNITRHHFQAWP